MTTTFAEDRHDHRLHGVTANTPQEVAAARAYVLAHARDVDDAVLLLDALGLPGQREAK